MTELDSVLDECLRQIERREASVEDCLARHPDHADDLRRLIWEALELRHDPSFDPDPRGKARMRARVRQHMRRHPRPRGSWLDGLLVGRSLRWAAAGLLALILAVGSMTWVAQAATPGAPLYPVKRFSEAVWGRIAGGDLDYQVWLTERRLAEWLRVQDVESESEAAREAYRRALSELEAQVDQELTAPVAGELQAQRQRLDAAGLREPKLDQLLGGPSGVTPVPSPERPETTPIPTTPPQPGEEATATEDTIIDDLLPTPENTAILP